MKVLIAEDDIASRRVLQTRLQKLGHQVLLAGDGTDAWERFQQEHIPLLLCDWLMPGLDGPALCRRIRAEKRRRYTYIILLTILQGKGRYLEGIRAGADDFMSKPYDMDLLLSRLHVAERILKLQDEVKQLQGLLPICQYCKKIRDDNNLWTQMEAYIADRTDADFTHGVCPECLEKHLLPQLEGLNHRDPGSTKKTA